MNSSRFAYGRLGAFSVLIFAGWALIITAHAQAEQAFHIGFSPMILGNVNKNDAMAAVKVFANEIVFADDLPLRPQTSIFPNIQAMKTALETQEVAAMSMTIPEYMELRQFMDPATIVIGDRGGGLTETYLLLVHRDSKVRTLGDLKDKSLAFLETGDNALALKWLEVELGKARLPMTRTFFKLKRVKKLNQAVLPVFFQNMDTCLVRQSGFKTLAELNPQISNKLRIVLQSQEFVTMYFGFRKGFNAELKEKILEKIETWHLTAAGRQILTIFKVDRLSRKPIACLDTALALLEQHKKMTLKNKRSLPQD